MMDRLPVVSSATFTSRRRALLPSAVYVELQLPPQHLSDSFQDCGTKLAGVPALRPREYATVSRPKKTVQRAYGGSRCANCVQDRIVRAFLIEEQKVVKKVLKESQQKKR
jgi:ribosomal protein L34E